MSAAAPTDESMVTAAEPRTASIPAAVPTGEAMALQAPGLSSARTGAAEIDHDGPMSDPTPDPPASPTPSASPVTPGPVAAEVAGRAVERGATAAPPSDIRLDSLLEELVLDIDPDGVGTVAISVAWGDQVASINGGRPVDSASAAKVYWAGAALAAGADPEALEPDALAVFRTSDNHAAGVLIDAAGGVDAVNQFTHDEGLSATSLSAWSYGTQRHASDRAERGLDNMTSTDDLVRFATALVAGDVLDDDGRRSLLAWMRATPDDLESSAGVDGLLTDRLPAFVAAATAHKAGWLSPGCCTRIQHVVVAVGIIPLGTGDQLRIAVAAQDTPDFDRSVDWVGHAACRVWAAIEHRPDCLS